MAPQIDLTAGIADTAFAFRGYNQTNLGRTQELLEHDAYRPILMEQLKRFSEIGTETLERQVDLFKYVEGQREPGLAHYAESLALVMAVELAQVRMLSEHHGVELSQAHSAFGYSLGELVAICCSGVFSPEEIAKVPLSMADDCANMAERVTMGVLFSRGPAIDEQDVQRLCMQITSEGRGTMGISAILSPNTLLLIGQNRTIGQFKQKMHKLLPHPAHLRHNSDLWPPVHTPIVRQYNIPDRTAVMLETLSGGFTTPSPPVRSLVTGEASYDDCSARRLLRDWSDHPQRLWDGVYGTLATGVKRVVHVGPEPNVIPATFRRLSDNIQEQTSGKSFSSVRARATAGLARRPWLSAILPIRAALLRAPMVEQVILEDWLLENAPTG